MKLKSIEDQVVVVFDASGGIGRETALRFAERGARVVVGAHGEPGLDSLVDEIREKGGQAIAVAADVTDFEQVQHVARRAVETYGRIDTWVHLPSVSFYAPFEQTTSTEFTRIMEVDLLGQAYAAQVALPYLKAGHGGAFIGVSSVEAEQSMSYHSAYAAAKHGVKGMLDALRMESRWEDAPVSITHIVPSSNNTSFFTNARTKPGGEPSVYAPSVVADTILYAAEHPVAEMIVGESGKFPITLRRFAPGMADRLSTWMGMGRQKTDKAKAASAPNNLYAWLETHRAIRWALTGATLGAIGVYALRTRSPHTYDALTRRLGIDNLHTARPLKNASRMSSTVVSSALAGGAQMGDRLAHTARERNPLAHHQPIGSRLVRGLTARNPFARRFNRHLVANGLMARGLLARGPFARGLLARGLMARGLLARGPFARGLLARGLFARGLLARGPFSHSVLNRKLVGDGVWANGAWTRNMRQTMARVR
jgi:NAD(P)-dependent dehydrogenase (short-subunit alcohol dehydrogenase family)